MNWLQALPNMKDPFGNIESFEQVKELYNRDNPPDFLEKDIKTLAGMWVARTAGKNAASRAWGMVVDFAKMGKNYRSWVVYQREIYALESGAGSLPSDPLVAPPLSATIFSTEDLEELEDFRPDFPDVVSFIITGRLPPLLRRSQEAKHKEEEQKKNREETNLQKTAKETVHRELNERLNEDEAKSLAAKFDKDIHVLPSRPSAAASSSPAASPAEALARLGLSTFEDFLRIGQQLAEEKKATEEKKAEEKKAPVVEEGHLPASYVPPGENPALEFKHGPGIMIHEDVGGVDMPELATIEEADEPEEEATQPTQPMEHAEEKKTEEKNEGMLGRDEEEEPDKEEEKRLEAWRAKRTIRLLSEDEKEEKKEMLMGGVDPQLEELECEPMDLILRTGNISVSQTLKKMHERADLYDSLLFPSNPAFLRLLSLPRTDPAFPKGEEEGKKWSAQERRYRFLNEKFLEADETIITGAWDNFEEKYNATIDRWVGSPTDPSLLCPLFNLSGFRSLFCLSKSPTGRSKWNEVVNLFQRNVLVSLKTAVSSMVERVSTVERIPGALIHILVNDLWFLQIVERTMSNDSPLVLLPTQSQWDRISDFFAGRRMCHDVDLCTSIAQYYPLPLALRKGILLQILRDFETLLMNSLVTMGNLYNEGGARTHQKESLFVLKAVTGAHWRRRLFTWILKGTPDDVVNSMSYTDVVDYATGIEKDANDEKIEEIMVHVIRDCIQHERNKLRGIKTLPILEGYKICYFLPLSSGSYAHVIGGLMGGGILLAQSGQNRREMIRGDMSRIVDLHNFIEAHDPDMEEPGGPDTLTANDLLDFAEAIDKPEFRMEDERMAREAKETQDKAERERRENEQKLENDAQFDQFVDEGIIPEEDEEEEGEEEVIIRRRPPRFGPDVYHAPDVNEDEDEEDYRPRRPHTRSMTGWDRLIAEAGLPGPAGPPGHWTLNPVRTRRYFRSREIEPTHRSLPPPTREKRRRGD